MAEGQWYVAHTYSGYENKVKSSIDQTIENRKLQDQIFEVMVPTQTVTEIKNGVKKSVERKLFPGYVFVRMHMNDDTWYIVRNTRGVTGFVGPGSHPVPLTEDEMANMGINAAKKVNVNYAVGDMVTVIDGTWTGVVSAVKRVDESRQKVTISVEMFGRETPVELGFSEIKKMS